MIRPKFCLYMCGSAARMSRNGDSTISVIMWRKRSGGNSAIGLTCCTPALLTRMSASSCRLLQRGDIGKVYRPSLSADLLGDRLGADVVDGPRR